MTMQNCGTCLQLGEPCNEHDDDLWDDLDARLSGQEDREMDRYERQFYGE